MIAWVKDSHDLPRWLLSATLVIGIHAALVSMLVRGHEPVEGFEGSEAIVVELTPVTPSQTESDNNLAPGPLQEQSDAAARVVPPQPQQPPEEKVEPQAIPDTEFQLPQSPTKVPETPNQRTSPRREITAPPKSQPSAAQIASWHRRIALQLERHKSYPLAARARHQTGTTELSFTIDRQGRVMASRVVRSSGFVALDQETIDTVRRAQPFPQPPANMRGETFSFTVPIRFNIQDRRQTP